MSLRPIRGRRTLTCISLYLPRISCYPPSVFNALIIDISVETQSASSKPIPTIHAGLFKAQTDPSDKAEETWKVLSLPRRAVRSKFFFRTVCVDPPETVAGSSMI